MPAGDCAPEIHLVLIKPRHESLFSIWDNLITTPQFETENQTVVEHNVAFFVWHLPDMDIISLDDTYGIYEVAQIAPKEGQW